MKLSVVADKVIRKFVTLGIEGWIKGMDAQTKDGVAVAPKSKKACKFCNEGVVLSIADRKTLEKMDQAWRDVLNTGMVNYNDTQSFGNNLHQWFKVRSYLREQEKNAKS